MHVIIPDVIFVKNKNSKRQKNLNACPAKEIPAIITLFYYQDGSKTK